MKLYNNKLQTWGIHRMYGLPVFIENKGVSDHKLFCGVRQGLGDLKWYSGGIFDNL